MESSTYPKISIITRLRNFTNSGKNYKYTLFANNNTSSNILYYSENPLTKIPIDKSKLNFFNFDKVYPPTYPINSIYQEIFTNPINDLFYNKSTCIFFFGPSFGGKSYLCRGSPLINEKESGLITRTINDIFSKIGTNSDFVVKISVYQVYLDKVNDLLLDTNNNYINIISNITKREIKNYKDFDLTLREAINNRKKLNKDLSMDNNDIKKISHLIISLYLENKKEINIIPLSQIDFIELVSCEYGLLNENEINNNLQNEIYISTNNTFNAIADKIMNLSINITNENNTLISCLKNTMQFDSNIILINCVIPWEYPLKHSYNSSKFTNMIYNRKNEYKKINNTKFIYSVDYNQINNNIKINPSNNLGQESMTKYLNNLTIDKMSIPRKDYYTQRRNNNQLKYNYNTDNKVEKYLLKLPKSNNKKNISNNNRNKRPLINSNKDKINKRINISFDIKNRPENQLKLNEINRALKELENQNKKLNQITKEESKLNSDNNDEINNIINNSNISANNDNNYNYSELKSDNIIMKQELERLQQMNKNLENYLTEERNRNLKIVNENQELENKIRKLEIVLNEIKKQEEKNKMNEINMEKILNEKISLDKKLEENIIDMNKLKEEKDYYEIEYKVLSKEFTELKNNYDILLSEFNQVKENHDQQLNGVEEKVDNLLNEIDKLRNENTNLRKDNENQRLNLTELKKENNEYNSKINELKKENELINIKYNEIMKEFDEFKKEKMNTDILKYKYEENKRIKNENKMKIVNELQSKIQNYRKQRFNQDN